MAVRVAAWLLPIVLSTVATYFIAQAIPRPRGLGPAVVWFLSLTVVATGILFVIDKVARRLLPLAALLNLSLVFPDRAPSRFRSALRTQTVHQLEENIATIKRTGLPDDPALAAETLIDLVAALSVHDRLTRGHAERVRAYTRMIGEEMKLDAADLEKLTWAGLLHDVGKLFVPAEILNKPSRLTDEEYEIIKLHPGWGAQLCEPLRGWLGEWVDAVGEHHERWDGKGYPNGIAGDDISLSARIVSVADVFDVITSVRSYKPAEGATNAREELARCAGTQFDPAVVRAFLNMSLGRLRLAMGPLSWLAQLPIIGRVPLAPAAGGAASVATTATALVAAGALGQTADATTFDSTAEAAPTPVTTTTTTVPPTPTDPIVVTTTTEPVVVVSTAPETTIAPATAPPTTAPPTTAPPTTAPPTTAPPTTPPPTAPPTTAPPTTAPPTAPPTTAPPTAPPTTAPPTTAPPTTLPPPPIAVDDAVEIDEGQFLTINVTTNDTNAASVLVTSPPPVGLVTQLAPKVLRYTPPPDWHGTTSFGYTIDDGTGRTSTATVTITVKPTPDAPVAVDDSASTDEDTAVLIKPLDNDSDPDLDPLTVTGVTSADGTPTTDGTTITYTPAPDSHGTHTISYTITDGTGRFASATISVTVAPTPDSPVAADDFAAVDEDDAVVISPLANDADVDGDTLAITGISTSDGTATTDGSTITYTPTADSNGTQTLSYTIDDGTGRTDTAVVTVTVKSLPDPPVAGDDSVTTDEDTPVVISVLTNDTDVDGDPLTVVGVSSPDGVATTDGTTITYTPAADSNGSQALTYTVDDGTGLTDTATVAITVNPVSDPPVANDDTATTDEDTAVTVTVLTNDTDIDGDPLTVVSATSTFGTATTDGTTVTFTPAPDTNGDQLVTYTIDDGTGLTDTATVAIVVNPVNDAPVAVGDTASTDEDTAVVITVLANDSDVDLDPLTVTGAASADGTPTTDGTTVTYTPAPDTFGTHSVTYTISDGTLTDTATVTITVDPVNDAPVTADDVAWTQQGSPVDVTPLDNDTDADGDPLTVTAASGTDGTVTHDGTTVSYTPTPTHSGLTTITYTVEDPSGLSDTGSIVVNVSSVPDTTDPTISATVTPPANAAGWHNGTVTVTFTCSDTGAVQSGIRSCADPVDVATEGAAQVVTGTAEDWAGNTVSTSVTLDIDLTGPEVTIVGFTDGEILPSVPTVSCTATDALSGVDGPCTTTTTPGANGIYTVEATAQDFAGNVTTETATFVVPVSCGAALPGNPCFVAAGDTWTGDLVWTGDVVILGDVTGNVIVTEGDVVVGSTGSVLLNVEQYGPGDVTVEAGGVVHEKVIEVGDGSVVVDGTVHNDVSEAGLGAVTVGAVATVDGKVLETGTGDVTIEGHVDNDVAENGSGSLTTMPGSTIKGKVLEFGAGNLTHHGSATNDVEEAAEGDLTISAIGTVDGKAREFGEGSLYVEGSVTSNVREYDGGDLHVLAGASIGGTAEELAGGDLIVDGPSSITGSVVESGDGSLELKAFASVGADADSTVPGTCTIHPTATVSGLRLNACAP